MLKASSKQSLSLQFHKWKHQRILLQRWRTKIHRCPYGEPWSYSIWTTRTWKFRLPRTSAVSPKHPTVAAVSSNKLSPHLFPCSESTCRNPMNLLFWPCLTSLFKMKSMYIYLNLFLVFSSFSFLLFNFKWIFEIYYLEEETNYTRVREKLHQRLRILCLSLFVLRILCP